MAADLVRGWNRGYVRENLSKLKKKFFLSYYLPFSFNSHHFWFSLHISYFCNLLLNFLFSLMLLLFYFSYYFFLLSSYQLFFFSCFFVSHTSPSASKYLFLRLPLPFPSLRNRLSQTRCVEWRSSGNVRSVRS